MFQIQAISSIVTATTATIFLLIVKNLQEPDEKEPETPNLSNESINVEIFTELSDASTEINNEIDYELLEEKMKFLENEILENIEIEEYKKTEIVEVYEDQKWNYVKTSTTSPQTDLTIEVTHNLRNNGQHRPYTLSLHFTPRPRGEDESQIPWTNCKLNVEWPLPKNVLVDIWSLRRLTPFTIDNYPCHSLNPSNIVAGQPTWSVKPKPSDLEVGSYDPKAKPFILTAQVPFRVDREFESTPRIENGKLVHPDAPWNLELHVPDLVIRYQPALLGSLFQKHPKKISYLPTPSLNFHCSRPEESESPESIHVEWQLNRLRPLQISLPVGSASPLVSHVTIVSVLMSSIFLCMILLKF